MPHASQDSQGGTLHHRATVVRRSPMCMKACGDTSPSISLISTASLVLSPAALSPPRRCARRVYTPAPRMLGTEETCPPPACFYSSSFWLLPRMSFFFRFLPSVGCHSCVATGCVWRIRPLEKFVEFLHDRCRQVVLIEILQLVHQGCPGRARKKKRGRIERDR